MKTLTLKQAMLWTGIFLFGGIILHGQQMRGPMMDRPDRPMNEDARTEHMQEMQSRMQEMHKGMQQMDQELKESLQAMEEAEGDEKIAAMEDTIRTLAEQRLQMHQHRQQMMEDMMGQMGQMGQRNGESGEQTYGNPEREEPDHEKHHDNEQ